MVGDAAADRLVLHRLSHCLEVLPGQLPGRLHGLAAARGEEDPVQIAGSRIRQTLGQRCRLGVRVGPEREERQLAGLLVSGLRELHPTVSDLHDEQARQPIEVALALRVIDISPVTAHDHRYVGLLVGRQSAEVHPEVVPGRVVEAALGPVAVREGGVGRSNGHVIISGSARQTVTTIAA